MPAVPFPRTALDVSYTPEWEIARTGLYQGKVANIGFQYGRRSLGWSSISLMGDVANHLDGSQRYASDPVPGTPYYLVSTSASDSAAGTGIRSVRVNYLNTAGVRTLANITLNGVTPVLVASDIKFVQYLESNLIGSEGEAVGDIYISSASVGVPTVAQMIDKISVGDGRSMGGRVMVPKDFNLYLSGWNCSSVKSIMDIRLSGKAFTDDRSVSPGYHFQDTAYLGDGLHFNTPLPSLRFEEGAIIKCSAIPSGAAATNRCDISFHFLLIAV